MDADAFEREVVSHGHASMSIIQIRVCSARNLAVRAKAILPATLYGNLLELMVSPVVETLQCLCHPGPPFMYADLH